MMIRMVGRWMFLLVPAHPGSPIQRAVKRLSLLFWLLWVRLSWPIRLIAWRTRREWRVVCLLSSGMSAMTHDSPLISHRVLLLSWLYAHNFPVYEKYENDLCVLLCFDHSTPLLWQIRRISLLLQIWLAPWKWIQYSSEELGWYTLHLLCCIFDFTWWLQNSWYVTMYLIN